MNLISKKIKIFLFLLFLFIGVHFALAQGSPDLGTSYGQNIGLTDRDPRDVAVSIIRIALGFLGIIAVGLMIYAGFLWMTAAGDEEKISKAKKIIIAAVVGIIIILASFLIVNFIISKWQSEIGNGNGPNYTCTPACISPDICCASGCQLPPCSPGPAPAFYVTGTVPPDQAIRQIRNVLVRGFFNNPLNNSVDQTVLNNNIKVEKIANIASSTGVATPIAPIVVVPGTASTTLQRREINFQPNAGCGVPGVNNCFEEWSKFRATINGASGLRDVGGTGLSCVGNRCIFEFSTGNDIDRGAPQIGIDPVQICHDDGNLKSDANTVGAWASDDYGLANINFNRQRLGAGEGLIRRLSWPRAKEMSLSSINTTQPPWPWAIPILSGSRDSTLTAITQMIAFRRTSSQAIAATAARIRARMGLIAADRIACHAWADRAI
jgi:hypothetical protein